MCPPSTMLATNATPMVNRKKGQLGSVMVATWRSLRWEGQVDRAGVALSCGSLIVIARITGPEASHRGELQGAVLVTAPDPAEPGDSWW